VLEQDRRVFGLKATIATCEEQKKTAQESGLRSWNMYVDANTENKLLRKKIAHATAKGLGWVLFSTAMGLVVGRML